MLSISVLAASLWLREATFLSSDYQGMKLGMDPEMWSGHPCASDICWNLGCSLLLAGRKPKSKTLGSCLYRSINHGLRHRESECFEVNTKILSHLDARCGSQMVHAAAEPVLAAPCRCSQ